MKVEENQPLRQSAEWRLRSRTLSLGTRTRIMGVVNITPDSFSDGGLYFQPDRAIDHALSLLEEGADILDLGAESTRPGSRAGNFDGEEGGATVSAGEEQTRLLPVIEGILTVRPDAVISVDTYKGATARTVIAAGAEIVNDVSGFLWDPQMAAACAELRCGAILMHTRGKPEAWKTQPPLPAEDVLPLVHEGLRACLAKAFAVGIPAESILLDPGYGFGKRFQENYVLLARQPDLLALGRPLLAGLSRKSFLSRTLSRRFPGATEANPVSAESCETASIAALVAAILYGASIVRVHRVRPAVEAAAIADSILAAR